MKDNDSKLNSNVGFQYFFVYCGKFFTPLSPPSPSSVLGPVACLQLIVITIISVFGDMTPCSSLVDRYQLYHITELHISKDQYRPDNFKFHVAVVSLLIFSVRLRVIFGPVVYIILSALVLFSHLFCRLQPTHLVASNFRENRSI
jgi:hypothetical protein